MIIFLQYKSINKDKYDIREFVYLISYFPKSWV